MASNFSSFYTSAEDHAVITATQFLATEGGKHMFSVIPTADYDNGCVFKLGDWEADDYYALSDDAPTFEGVILQEESNGGWLIQVTDVDDDTVLLYQSELIYENYTTKMQEASQYYNAADEVTRAYGLAKYDKFAITDEGFEGDPEVGATVTVNSSTHKLVVATATE